MDFNIKCGHHRDVFFNDDDQAVRVTVSVKDDCTGDQPVIEISKSGPGEKPIKTRRLDDGGGVARVQVPSDHKVRVLCNGQVGRQEACSVSVSL